MKAYKRDELYELIPGIKKFAGTGLDNKDLEEVFSAIYLFADEEGLEVVFVDLAVPTIVFRT